jgi:hypothetical protein
MMYVASSQRSHGDEAKDRRVVAMGCIGLFYLNFVIFVVLGHKGSLVISLSINRTPRVGGDDQAFSHPPPTPSHNCFLRGVDVLHGVREARK